MENTLDESEQKLLAEAESTIATSACFIKRGSALSDIRRMRLYRVGYQSFTDYGIRKWGFSRAYALKLIVGFEFVQRLPPDLPKPTKERQIRCLVPLSHDMQVHAWREMCRRAALQDRHPNCVDAADVVAELVPGKRTSGSAQKTQRGKETDWVRLKELADLVCPILDEMGNLNVDVNHKIPARSLCENLAGKFSKLARKLAE